MNIVENYITRIQAKPDAYKRRFAILVAALITGVIFCFWLISLRVRLAEQSIEKNAQKAANARKFGKDTTANASLSVPPLQSVIETVKQGWEGVTEIKEMIQKEE